MPAAVSPVEVAEGGGSAVAVGLANSSGEGDGAAAETASDADAMVVDSVHNASAETAVADRATHSGQALANVPMANDSDSHAVTAVAPVGNGVGHTIANDKAAPATDNGHKETAADGNDAADDDDDGDGENDDDDDELTAEQRELLAKHRAANPLKATWGVCVMALHENSH